MRQRLKWGRLAHMRTLVRRYRWLLATFGIVLLVAAWWLCWPQSHVRHAYHRIKIGMTPDEVRLITGRHGLDRLLDGQYVADSSIDVRWECGDVPEVGGALEGPPLTISFSSSQDKFQLFTATAKLLPRC
jgi:hypothetical protein